MGEHYAFIVICIGNPSDLEYSGERYTRQHSKHRNIAILFYMAKSLSHSLGPS